VKIRHYKRVQGTTADYVVWERVYPGNVFIAKCCECEYTSGKSLALLDVEKAATAHIMAKHRAGGGVIVDKRDKTMLLSYVNGVAAVANQLAEVAGDIKDRELSRTLVRLVEDLDHLSTDTADTIDRL
jgi:hypothetical protein